MTAERYRIGTPEPVLETTHLPPVLITYTEDGQGWTATYQCADPVIGFPCRAADLKAVRACTWTLLRQLKPSRPVAEHVAAGDLASHAVEWELRGGTTLAGPTAAR